MENLEYKYIVYKTTNLVNGKIYIGVHKTLTPYEFDGYLGNGIYINSKSRCNKNYVFHRAILKYGFENFKRETIKIFDNEKDAYTLEKELVNEDFVNSENTYNMVLGGCGGDRNVMAKKCYKYDLDGNYICEYDSQYEAARDIGAALCLVSHDIKHKTKCHNYYFSLEKCEHLDLSNYKTDTNRIKVYQYSCGGEYECEYESLSEAGRQLKTESSLISRSIRKGYLLHNKHFSYNYYKIYNRDKALRDELKPIYQYDVDGTFIKEFENINIAEKELNTILTFGPKIVKNKLYGGYQWSYEKVESMPDIRQIYHKHKPRKVGQYTLDGQLVKTFNTVTECVKEFVGCRHVLSGRNSTSGGYTFKYLD